LKDSINSNKSLKGVPSKKFASVTRRTSMTTIIARLTVLLLAFASCYSSPSISDAITDNTNGDDDFEDDDAVSVLKLDPKITYDDIIPPTNYTSKYSDIQGLHYPPVAAANNCLFYFNHPSNKTAMSYGVYVAEWLALRAHHYNNQSSAGEDSIYFTHDFPWSHYNLTAGWKSALAQGLAAECFMEAYSYTGNSTFADLARKSLMFLTVPVSEGGVMIDEGNGRWWYEEYARPAQNKHPQVLNGHQFVLLSLNRYLQQINNNDTDIRQIFDNGLNALKSDAQLYDNGYNNSFYDRLGNLAKGYHKTHIINFERLYNVTGDAELLRIKKVFEQ
jgi:hypothetical protein